MAKTSDELIPTRATLLQRLQNWQDQSSWQDFFDTYWSLIYGVAIKAGLTPTEAQDVVQETIISVAKHMPNFKYDPSVGSFKAWLLNMTRWRIADQLRKRGPVSAYSASVCELTPEDIKLVQEADVFNSDLEKQWDAEWEKNLFDAAVAKARRRLDPKQYQIFDLYVNKNVAPRKISDMFNISVGQVYLAKHRVTETIRQEVERLKQVMV